MKVSMIKLRGRAYLMGNLLLLCLLFFTVVLFSVCFNILPETAVQMFSDLPQSRSDVITALVSVAVIFLLFSVFSSADMGLHRFFLRKAQRKGGGAKDLFFYFKPGEAGKLMAFSLRLILMKIFFFLLCFMPFLLNLLLVLRLVINSASLNVSIVMLTSSLALLFNGAFFYSQLVSSLFLVKYYYAEGEYLNFRQLVSSSQNQMKKHKRTLRRLKISFAGWFLSCIFILPIGYVFSYFRQSKAVAAADFMCS